jgi:hypothetical protein
VTINVNEESGRYFVGYQGESGSRHIGIDFSAWRESCGDGVLTVLLQRPGDTAPYPVTDLTVDEDVATWTPSATDTAVSGSAVIQFEYIVDGVIAKSSTLNATVGASLGEATDPPDPYESWLDTLIVLAAETRENAAAAEQSADDAAASQEAAEAAKDAAEESAIAAGESKDDAEAAQAAAEDAASRAEQAAAQSGYMFFYIDDEGHLIYQHTSNTEVDFYLSNGHLYVEAVA